ncbi:hypothetical protein E9549_17075, partial [Blastococcus sp. MG754426]|nr:hypothetical protein [Blastococcus sp. MG754426]
RGRGPPRTASARAARHRRPPAARDRHRGRAAPRCPARACPPAPRGPQGRWWGTPTSRSRGRCPWRTTRRRTRCDPARRRPGR